VGALKGVLSRSAGQPLLEISSLLKLEELKERILGASEVVALDSNGKGMYRAAYNHYANFLRQRSGTLPVDPPPVSPLKTCLSEFRFALSVVGFTQFGGAQK
jgi:hypothetical protein